MPGDNCVELFNIPVAEISKIWYLSIICKYGILCPDGGYLHLRNVKSRKICINLERA